MSIYYTHECLHYSSYDHLVVLFKAEYMLSHVIPTHILNNSGLTLSFHWIYSRKQRLVRCISGHKRPKVKQTLKPAWRIIIIMPQSVCSQVWQIPRTWRQNRVLRCSETKWIWNIKQKRTKGNVCFLFVERIASCGYLTTNYGLVEKLYCTTGSYIQIPPKTKQVRAEEIFHW